jgi:hypothetical protein
MSRLRRYSDSELRNRLQHIEKEIKEQELPSWKITKMEIEKARIAIILNERKLMHR